MNVNGDHKRLIKLKSFDTNHPWIILEKEEIMKMYFLAHFLPYKWKQKWGFVGMLVQKPLPVLDMIGYDPERWEYIAIIYSVFFSIHSHYKI